MKLSDELMNLAQGSFMKLSENSSFVPNVKVTAFWCKISVSITSF